MALVIGTNVASLNAQRNLNSTQNLLNRSMQRLSSGLRINSAKDDAAGLAISDRMTSQVRGLNQAARNANDAISLAQTAEGALQETTNLLQRMREIAVQAGNDTNSASDRASLQDEFDELVLEITRISDQTSFNNTNILDGTFTGIFQIGANASETITVALTQDMDAAALAVNALTVDSNVNAGAAITAIDTAIGTVDTVRGNLGATQSRLESTIANLTNISENISAARSRILDADIAAETSAMTKASILQQAGVAVLAQANQTPQLALSLLA
ncbi:MAG: flagellin FliC [Desulfobacterales bacterium]|nr:flagellin FliC [Desulfobacterales bacterium]